jgi:hypothetical protein
MCFAKEAILYRERQYCTSNLGISDNMKKFFIAVGLGCSQQGTCTTISSAGSGTE